MKLPKEIFTLTEWVDFVDAHPEYLTINTPKHLTPKAVIMAFEKGLDNLIEFTTPLVILREKLSRENFVVKQRIECTDLYNNCVSSPDLTFEETKGAESLKYKLVGGLIVRDCAPQKVVVPPSLIGPLLAHTHLFGHKGLNRMPTNLSPYHFDTKYTVVKKFFNSCSIVSCRKPGLDK